MEKVLTIDLNSNPIQTLMSDELIEELDRMRSENKKLSDMLILARRDYDDVMTMMQGFDKSLEARGCKRKCIDGDNNNTNNCECCCGGGLISSSCIDEMPTTKVMKSNHVSKVHVRIDPSDVSLVVKDGYQWRKYGQKVTRDNPSPRAYYKCSFSPSCPAKKKVQRSVDDPSLLVAMYEGQHQHPGGMSSHVETSGVSGAVLLSPTSTIDVSSGFLENWDLKLNGPTSACNKTQNYDMKIENREIDHKLLAVQMASVLTRNRAFIDALAAAITSKILDDVVYGNNDDVVPNFTGAVME